MPDTGEVNIPVHGLYPIPIFVKTVLNIIVFRFTSWLKLSLELTEKNTGKFCLEAVGQGIAGIFAVVEGCVILTGAISI